MLFSCMHIGNLCTCVGTFCACIGNLQAELYINSPCSVPKSLFDDPKFHHVLQCQNKSAALMKKKDLRCVCAGNP